MSWSVRCVLCKEWIPIRGMLRDTPYYRAVSSLIFHRLTVHPRWLKMLAGER